MHLTVPVTQPFYSTLKFRAAGFEPAWLSDIKCREGATALTNLVRGYAVFPVKLRPVSHTAVVTQHCRVLLRFFLRHEQGNYHNKTQIRKQLLRAVSGYSYFNEYKRILKQCYLSVPLI